MTCVLFLNAGHRELWRKQGGRWEHTQAPSGHVWVISNLAEESISEISMPRLWGSDRTSFLARQLDRCYPASAFRSLITAPDKKSFIERILPLRHIAFGIDTPASLEAELDLQPASIAGVWPITMLLANLIKRRALPESLIVVFPGPSSLRIACLRRGVPVLTRLALHEQVEEQVDEILRTQRFLKKSQILGHEDKALPVLVIGNQSKYAQAMWQAGITLLDNAALSKELVDWRFTLFDLVIKSPQGQIAPQSRRIAYVAERFGKAALALAVMVLLGGFSTAARYTLMIIDGISQKATREAAVVEAQSKITRLEADFAKLEYPPALVRKTLKLDTEEIRAIPRLEEHLRLLSSNLAADENLRIKQLDWRLLGPNQPACASSSVATIEEAGAPPSGRLIEIAFDLGVPDTYGPRDRASALSGLADRLKKIDGINLLQDAAAKFKSASLQGGKIQSAAENYHWCISLPESKMTGVKTS